MPVQVLPSGRRTQIARIVTADGDLTGAVTGQAVCLALSDEVDASRGDVLAAIGPATLVTDRIGVRLVWIGAEALAPDRPYLLKLAAATVKAAVEPLLHVVDLETNQSAAADRLLTNEIGTALIRLDRFVAADRYANNRETGSFILIDTETHDTVGLGIIETVNPAGDQIVRQHRERMLHKRRWSTDTHGGAAYRDMHMLGRKLRWQSRASWATGQQSGAFSQGRRPRSPLPRRISLVDGLAAGIGCGHSLS